MSNNKDQNNIPEEIDLGILFQKINKFYGNLAFSIFKVILFLKEKALILISLLVIGGVLGYFIDKTNITYNSEIIVSPNMQGTDYLYSKIELISSKLKESDIVFLKSIGFEKPKKIVSIKVEPIIDIYNFVNNSASAANASNTQNFELIKLLAEKGDIKKVIEDELTSKNYPHHKITIITSYKTTTNEVIKPLLKFLNTDEYLNKILTTSKQNMLIKMNKNEELISQTDSLIRILTLNLSKNQKNSNLVYNNENNQFNSLFDLKNDLINELASQRITLINSNQIVKDISTVINIKNIKGINGKMKLLVPFLFIFLFIFLRIFISFYKKQAAKLT
jgi:hypothetical protein